MFSSTKIYAPVHPSYLNRPTANIAYADPDKENRNPFTNKVQHPNFHYDTDSQSNHPKARLFNSLAEVKPSSSVSSSQAFDYPSSFSVTVSNQDMMLNKNTQGCQHASITKSKRSYCKGCGIFFPKSRVETYREHTYSQKIDNHPDEVYSIMIQRQMKNREFVKDSHHLKHRKILIDWICEIGADHEFCSDTISIAISYIDTVLSKLQVPKSKLQLISLCCLIAAGKFSEKDEKVPTYKEIFELCKGTYPMDYFKQAEKLVFDTLKWELKTVTPHHFVHFYLSKGCAFSSDQTLVRDIDVKLLRYLRKYSEFFIEMSLKDYNFVSYKSSINACAAIAAGRKAVGLYPLWTPELEELTETSWEEIELCFSLLYSSFEKAHPEIAKKANSYTAKAAQAEQSFVAMTIEGAVGTPFRQNQHKSVTEDDAQSSKKESANASLKKNIDWSTSTNRGYCNVAPNPSVVNVGIKLFKGKDEEHMSIENIGENAAGKESIGSKVKRNLVF